MRDPGGVLIVRLRAGPRVCNLFSSFRLHLVQYSTSVAINYISEISSTARFDWRPSRAPKRSCCLRIHHVLLLPTSTFCLVASSPELRSARSLRQTQALNKGFPTSPGATWEGFSLSRYVAYFEFLPSPVHFTSASCNTQPLWPQTTILRSP